MLALELRRDPDLNDQLRVIESLGPYPIQPVVASTKLYRGIRSEIARSITRVRGQVLKDHLVEKFVAVDDGDYKRIRQMLSEARSAVVEAPAARAGRAS